LITKTKLALILNSHIY